MRLEWLTLPMGACALTDARFAVELMQSLRVVAGELAESRSAVPAQRPEPERQRSLCLLVPLRPLAKTHANDAIDARTTRLQWFVLNPLEELHMGQRARLVLDERDRRKREAERARRERLLERVARVQVLEPRVREHASGLLEALVSF